MTMEKLLNLLNALREEFPNEKFVIEPRRDPEEGDECIALIVETKLDVVDAIERIDRVMECHILADFGVSPHIIVTLGFI